MTPPKLNSRILRNPALIGDVLDEWMRLNTPMREARRVLQRHQMVLRRRCDALDPSGRTWRLFLRVDDAHVYRLVDALSRIAVWAFNQGRRAARTRGEK